MKQQSQSLACASRVLSNFEKKKIKKNQFSLAGKKSVMYTYGKFAKAHIFLNYNVQMQKYN